MSRQRLLLLLAVPLFAGCGSSTAKPATVPPPPETQAAAQPGSGPLGSTAHDGGLAVTVMSTQAERSLPGDPSAGLGPRPATNGWYVAADVRVQNTGTAAEQPGQFYVQTPDGARYEATSISEFSPEFPFAPTVVAGDQEAGKVAFDVPAQHARLVYAAGSVPVYSWTY